jgi:outer membrane biosynthesis protein TonB
MPFVFSPGTPSATVASASASGGSGNGAAAGAIATPGTLDRDRVANTIRARMPSLSLCYQRASQQEPQLAGRVLVRFVVNPDGRVVDAQASPTTQAGSPSRMNDVARCVQSAFFSFVFYPPTGGAAAAVLPLDFGPTS